jgi:hypothetical protein
MERKLAAILCGDVFGYSRLIGEDEEATLRTFTSHRKLVAGVIVYQSLPVMNTTIATAARISAYSVIVWPLFHSDNPLLELRSRSERLGRRWSWPHAFRASGSP